MATDLKQQAYFCVLRWRRNPTRDEARNVAVILTDVDGRIGGVRWAPLSTISSNLREQGLLDAMLVGLEHRFASEEKLTLADLTEMHQSLLHSLYLTEPRPVAVPDVDLTLNALYRAYAAPHAAGARTLTKGVVLDRTVTALRRHGLEVRRGDYVGDFLFDIVVDAPEMESCLIEVLSFATPKKDWSITEYDAGHFLYALEQVDKRGLAVIEPPSEETGLPAVKSHERVRSWLKKADVRTVAPGDVVETLKPEVEQLRLEAVPR